MKVKSIRNYHDLQLGKLINAGEVLEVADARGKVLIDAKVAEEVVTPPTPEKVAKPAPKKRVSKKNVEG